MDVREAIDKRRAYRSLDPVPITEELIKDLTRSAQLAPTCNNNQPWRAVFVYSPDMLEKMKSTLTHGNEWAFAAAMMIAVFSRKDFDCVIKEREYFRFGVGMQTAFLILRATELGLVAHPIAGFREAQVKEVLGIPEDMTVITLVMIGKHSATISPVLSEKQVEQEKTRPERLPMEKVIYMNNYKA
jgi:nitroreductase